MPDLENVILGQVRSGEDMSGQVTSGHIRPDQDKVRLGHVRSCLVRSGQVMSNHVKIMRD